MTISTQYFTKKYQAAVIELLRVEGHWFYHDILHEVSVSGIDLSEARFNSCCFEFVDFTGSVFSKDTFAQCLFLRCIGLTDEMESVLIGINSFNRVSNK